MLVAVRAVGVTPVGAVGGWPSEHGVVEAVTVARCERLPAASRASTSNLCAVPHVRPVTFATGCVTVAASDPFRYTTYWVTATLSVAADHSSEMLVSLAEPTRARLAYDLATNTLSVEVGERGIIHTYQPPRALFGRAL